MILKEIIDELVGIDKRGSIKDPDGLFLVGHISNNTKDLIGTDDTKVYISRKSLKHIIDQRGSINIITELPTIISKPTKIVNNSSKRQHSFIFALMNGKARGAVIEITKTPDGNRVVSAFLISKNTYKKLIDISGRSAVPPFSTLPKGEKSS